ncbi:MAG: phosphate signaling complex protein PhoU [Candidatus Calescibacterium sp.]|nr:phosphate signaling complex protein PhoU [Candidatus Calescibacterium sp.]
MVMVERKIEEVKEKLIEFSEIVKGMLKKSIKGLMEKDERLLKEVIEEDEMKCNDLEIEIDEMCIHIIAQFEPRAKHLRTIFLALKMNNDLERMGDHAVNISQSGLFLISKPQVKPLLDIPRMAEEVSKMLEDSLKSFVNEDAALAKSVCERDDIIDDYRDQIVRELITYMVSDPSTIERALHLIRISGNLERIADLTTNICEDVIFMVKGELMKHHKTIKF